MAAQDLADITAVIVTRGDVALGGILKTLPYKDVRIWDNRKHVLDAGTFGRWLSADAADSDLVYFQDDDILFTEHAALLTAHRQAIGVATVNMPSPWYDWVQKSWAPVGKPMAMFGAGCLVPRSIVRAACAPYLDKWGADELWLELCDLCIGTFMPHQRVDLGFEILPAASLPDRISTRKDHVERRAQMQARVVALLAER